MSKYEDWSRRAAYLKWMKILAVLALVLNVVTEVHNRQLTDSRLPETIASVVSYLAFASVSLLFAGAVGGLMIYLNERRYR